MYITKDFVSDVRSAGNSLLCPGLTSQPMSGGVVGVAIAVQQVRDGIDWHDALCSSNSSNSTVRTLPELVMAIVPA